MHEALYDEDAGQYKHINYDEFISLIRPYHELLGRAFAGELVVPDFNQFRYRVRGIYEQVATLDGGKLATYIPQLAKQDPSLFGVSVCTKDAQRFDFGDASVDLCLQSCCVRVIPPTSESFCFYNGV